MGKPPKLQLNETRRAWREIEPLGKWIRKQTDAANREAWPALIKFVSQKAGRPIHRSNIEKWISLNESNRVEPRFGFGLILVDARKHFTGK